MTDSASHLGGQVICAACGARSGRTKLRKDSIEIVQCPECGLAWWTPPSGFRPDQMYDAAYFDGAGVERGYDDYAGLEASLRATFARRLRRLPVARPGGRLLDVGAAFGFAVDEAVRGGWTAFGVEVSRDAARQAARVTGGRVAAASAIALPFPDQSFAAVTLFDVLEHLPMPHAALAEVVRVLQPGGRLMLTTGDVESAAARLSGRRWHLYTLPEHLFFYSRRSLRLLLEAHGLEVEAMSAEGATFTLGYLVERLRKTLLGRPKGGPARWPGARLRLRVNLFDVLSVEAVRSRSNRG